MRFIVYVIFWLLIFASCNKNKISKDSCMEAYVGHYKLIEMKKSDGTIISSEKIKDSLNSEQVYIVSIPKYGYVDENFLLFWPEKGSDQTGWDYYFHWLYTENGIETSIDLPIRSCEQSLIFRTTSLDTIKKPTVVEFLPDTCNFRQDGANYIISNSLNSAELKLIKQ